jgi:2-dehydro-3-deoxyphosphogluconate aldolase/(4S)-4-hydroxy-2-oxoglutarate aldolase
VSHADVPPLPEALLEGRVVAVARRLDAAAAVRLCDALLAGGLDVLEVTMEGGEGPTAIAAARGRGLEVGAGTVLTIEDAAAAVDAGAGFLVSPHVDAALIAWANARGVPFLAGAFTPTEVLAAHRAGAAAVKVFPAAIGGPAHVAALRAPFPGIGLVPTGGVDADTVAAFLGAGALAVGVGAWLTAADDPALVAERAGALLAAASAVGRHGPV